MHQLNQPQQAFLSQQQQYRMFIPQAAYPVMANMRPTETTQGVFSTYPARLRHSSNNALLLPESYLTKKTRFQGNESDDEFDEMEEESEEDDSKVDEDKGEAENKNVNFVKVIRQKKGLDYSFAELLNVSEIEEVLAPIRLDIDVDDIKLRDRFLWNMNEQYLTPEKFAEMLCEDLQLPTYKFIQPIADSIRTQVMDFESYHQIVLPPEHTRIVINLDLQIGKINYRDQFEWDMQDEKTNAPEVFSRQLASELGVGGEYIVLISHAIREQLLAHKKHFADESDGGTRPVLENALRPVEEAKQWAPRMDILSNDELEKLLIAQERNIRRMRRETRFKRQSRGR